MRNPSFDLPQTDFDFDEAQPVTAQDTTKAINKLGKFMSTAWQIVSQKEGRAFPSGRARQPRYFPDALSRLRVEIIAAVVAAD
ncbi:hypothetical protein [Luteolibacter sp. Populi]|uniref:hypothetical protein n=1 Tax=Luteolibacter sp. Populi TaxID=3230487 RepID=UPI003464F85F